MEGWSEAKETEIRAAFGLFNKKNEENINLNEFVTAVAKIGYKLSNEDLKEIVKEVDSDGNGDIDYGEFAILMDTKLKDNDSDEEIAESFKIFDKKNRGLINKEDIRQVLESLHEKITAQELDLIINKWGNVEDGSLTFDQFKKMFQDN